MQVFFYFQYITNVSLSPSVTLPELLSLAEPNIGVAFNPFGVTNFTVQGVRLLFVRMVI